MTRRQDEPRLAPEVESLLSGWPVRERSADEWEQSAERISARLAEAGTTDDAWLAAPLPAQDDEGSLNVADDSGPRRAASRDAPPISLAALARASVEQEQADDAKDIVRESLTLAKQARQSAPSIPHSVRDSAARLAAAEAARVSDVPKLPEVVEAAPAPRSSSTARGFVAGLFVATVVAAAAATILVLRPTTEPPGAPPAELAAAKPAVAEQPATPAVSATAAPDEEVLSLDDLPADAATPGRTAYAPRVAKGGGAAGSKLAAPAPEAAKEAKPTTNDKDDPDMRPAAKATDVPEKPSVGAVQAAVASVLGSARACVGGHDQPSQATITFGSNGRVKGVAVSGAAAGTPAAACIKSALTGARVQPFARDSFSASITVRP